MASGMDRAVEAAQGALKLATALNVTHQAVYQWVQRGWAPPARAIEIENLYGIPRAELISPALRSLLDQPNALV